MKFTEVNSPSSFDSAHGSLSTTITEQGNPHLTQSSLLPSPPLQSACPPKPTPWEPLIYFSSLQFCLFQKSEQLEQFGRESLNLSPF